MWQIVGVLASPTSLAVQPLFAPLMLLLLLLPPCLVLRGSGDRAAAPGDVDAELDGRICVDGSFRREEVNNLAPG